MLSSSIQPLARTLGIYALIPAVMFFLFGFQTLRVAIMQFGVSRGIKTLIPVPGRINSSHVEEKEVHHYSKSGSGDSMQYKPVITYTYVVDGQEYHGERVNLNLQFFTQASAKAQVALYPANSNVTVFYSPRQPDWSVLETKIRNRLTELFVGLLLLVAAAFCVYLAMLNPHMPGIF
jgi:hypothetical protein